MFTNENNPFVGRIRDTYSSAEFRKAVNKKIDYLKECITNNQEQISRLEKL